MIAESLALIIATASVPDDPATAEAPNRRDSRPVQPSVPSGDLPQPSAFDMAMADWVSCERPRMWELGRRLGRAGPGGNANLDGLGDCGVAEGRLTAAIEALPTAAARAAARARVDEARAGFRAEMDDIYARNNHE